MTITVDDIALAEPPITEEDRKEKRIAVVEIFGPTFQGEGPLAGSKTMFIRFGGCDFRCRMCDSLHAVIPTAVKKHARYLTAEEIADEVKSLRGETNTAWITLSGGNPCMWDLSKLVALLHGMNLGVAVETQGSLWQPWLLNCQMVVISPKGPGMGEKCDGDKLLNVVTKLWEKKVAAAIKVVAFSQQDLDFAFEVWSLLNNSGKMPPNMQGMFYLSLGNSYPPELNTDTLEMEENSILAGKSEYDDAPNTDHRLRLLADYQVLMEDFLNDPRLPYWMFIPQLHVLTYSNEAER